MQGTGIRKCGGVLVLGRGKVPIHFEKKKSFKQMLRSVVSEAAMLDSDTVSLSRPSTAGEGRPSSRCSR